MLTGYNLFFVKILLAAGRGRARHSLYYDILNTNYGLGHAAFSSPSLVHLRKEISVERFQ